MVAILTQINPVNNFPFYFCKIHFNIILPSLLRSSKLFLSVRLTNICHACHMPYPSQSTSTDHPNNIWEVNNMTLYTIFSNLLSLSPTSIQILPSAPCSQISSGCVPSSVSEKNSHLIKVNQRIKYQGLHCNQILALVQNPSPTVTVSPCYHSNLHMTQDKTVAPLTRALSGFWSGIFTLHLASLTISLILFWHSSIPSCCNPVNTNHKN